MKDLQLITKFITALQKKGVRVDVNYKKEYVEIETDMGTFRVSFNSITEA